MSQLFKTHSVTVKRQTVTNTDAASDSKEYTTGARGSLPTKWTCRVVPLGLDERLKYAQTGQDVTHAVYGLTNPQVDERDLFVFGESSRELYVETSHNPDELNRYWKVLCNEVTGAAR